MDRKLNWGIVGTGQIARTFVTGLQHSQRGQALAVASRSKDRAEQFGREMGLAKRYGHYTELLTDSDVEAVYIATPHPEHREWAIRAANQGKHVLCEKPIGINVAEAQEIINAAEENNVFLMEAFMYRCHPQTAKIVELVKAGAIGRVQFIQAAFGFRASFDARNRLWDKRQGGGGILDVGCYAVSFARLIAGAANGLPFVEPLSLTAMGYLHPQSGVDVYTAATLRFPNDIIAQVSTAIGLEMENVAHIYGSEGSIFIPEPWTASTKGQESRIVVRYVNKPDQEIVFENPGWLYALEADTVARDISQGQATPPAMTWADTLGNMRTLDQWRAAIGLRYDGE